jgi:hypothetical protein
MPLKIILPSFIRTFLIHQQNTTLSIADLVSRMILVAIILLKVEDNSQKVAERIVLPS